jgi:hypothetical protein
MTEEGLPRRRCVKAAFAPWLNSKSLAISVDCETAQKTSVIISTRREEICPGCI